MTRSQSQNVPSQAYSPLHVEIVQRLINPIPPYLTGNVGLKSWFQPQAHVFPSNAGSSSSVTANTLEGDPCRPLPRTFIGQTTAPADIPSSHVRRPQESPLKVRKTRENLRQCTKQTNAIDASPTAPFVTNVPSVSNDENQRIQQAVTIHPKSPVDKIVVMPSVPSARPSLNLGRTRTDFAVEDAALPRASAETTRPAPSLQRKKSVHRRVISKVKEGILTRSRSTLKFPGRESSASRQPSTQSTAEPRVSFEGYPASDPSPNLVVTVTAPVNPALQASGSPSPENTPRPARRHARPPSPVNQKSNVAIPQPPLAPMHIRLRLLPDIQSLDVNEESVIWVAVEAEATTTSPTADRQIGEIRKLKLSVRPETGVLLDVVGQRTISSLSAGQRLEMFLKVNILRKQNLSCSQSTTKLMDTLTAELERELGYGSTALFTVTARYRHSLLPEDTILMVRHHCKIRRPNRDSMWSLPGDEAPTDGVTYNGQKHLIDFLIRNNPPDVALSAIREYVDPSDLDHEHVLNLQRSGADCSSSARRHSRSISRPTTIHATSSTSTFSTGLSTPQSFPSSSPLVPSSNLRCLSATSSCASPQHTGPSSVWPPAQPLPSSPSPISYTARSDAATTQAILMPPSDPDEARQIWRHMRNHSRSISTQHRNSAESIERLTAADENVAGMRRQALMNKRSVGADTLKEWSWQQRQGIGMATQSGLE